MTTAAGGDREDGKDEAFDAWSDTPLARFAVLARGRVLALCVLLLSLVMHLLSDGDVGSRIRNAVFDYYHRMSPRAVENLPVAIVNVDEASLDQYGQWPWPRVLLAELIEKTAARGALAVGLDIVMPEGDRMSPYRFASTYPDLEPEVRDHLNTLPSNDEILAETIRDLPVVLGRAAMPDHQPAHQDAAAATAIQHQGGHAHGHVHGFEGHLANVPEIEEAASGFGYLNTVPDPDGTVRHMPAVMRVGDQVVPSMGVELIRVALGANWLTINLEEEGLKSLTVGEAELPVDRQGKMALHFSHADQRRHVSAAAVLNGTAPDDAFSNQLVLVGVTALGLTDAPPTPVAARMDGVEIQAQFIENLLFGTRLNRHDLASHVELIAVLISGIFLIMVMPRLGPVMSMAPTVVLVAALFGAGFGAFAGARILLDPAYPALSTMLVFATLMISHLVDADRQRRLMNLRLARQRLENARMAGELTAARDIQMGILPQADEVEGLPDNVDIHAYLEPAKEVGGDLYDIFMVDGHRLYFMVGDVSGKGVPASLFMALSKALCKSAVLRAGGTVADLMTIANAEISRENPAFMFVTAVAGILDTKTGALEYCNAGHDSPLALNRDGELRTLDSAGGPPICVMDDFDYPVEHDQLAPGELLLLYSDGVSEAMRVDEAMYGNARIGQFLIATGPQPGSREVVDGLFRDVKTFVDGNEPNDDITILALRYHPEGGE